MEMSSYNSYSYDQHCLTMDVKLQQIYVAYLKVILDCFEIKTNTLHNIEETLFTCGIMENLVW